MRADQVTERLAAGQPVFGPMVMDRDGPGLPQIVANAGADSMAWDLEDACLDVAAVKTQLALARGTGQAPLVNSPWHD